MVVTGWNASQSGEREMNAVVRLLLGAGMMVLLAGCDEPVKTEIVPIPQNAVPSSLEVVVADNGSSWPPLPVIALDASASYDPDGGDVSVAWEVADAPEGSDLSERLAGSHRPEVVALLTAVGEYRVRARLTGTGNRVKVSPWMNFSVQHGIRGPALRKLRGLPVSADWQDLYVYAEPEVPVALLPPAGVPEGVVYRWVLQYVPEDSHATLTGEDQPSPEFTADTVGNYGVALEVLRDGVTQAVALYVVSVRQDEDDVEQPVLGKVIGTGLVSAQLIPGTRTLVAHGGRKLVVRNLDEGESHELLLSSNIRGVAISPAGTQALVPLTHGIALIDLSAATPALLWSKSLIDQPYQYYLDALWIDDDRAFVVTSPATGGSSSTPLTLFQVSDKSFRLLSNSLIDRYYYGDNTVGTFLVRYEGAALYSWSSWGLRRTEFSATSEPQGSARLTFAPCVSNSSPTVLLSSNRIAACGILFDLSATGVTSPLAIINYPANSIGEQILSADGTAIYGVSWEGVWKVDAVSSLPPERLVVPGVPYGSQFIKVLSTPQVPLAVVVMVQSELRVFFVNN